MEGVQRIALENVTRPREEWVPYDPRPSYMEIIPLVYNTFVREWSRRKSPNWWIVDFANDVRNFSCITVDDLLATVIVAVIFTVLRSSLTESVFKPVAARLKLRKGDREKFPESMFKAMYYASSFFYAAYIIFGTGEDFFHEPSLFWSYWSHNIPVPKLIYGLYIFQLGFYVHAMYGVLVLDARRKDTFVMLLHHIITLFLIYFSLAVRFYRIGIVVMFLHDIADIFLEFGKLSMSIRYRGKNFDQVMDHVSTACFVMFMLSWLYCRLIFYLSAVLYVTGHMSTVVMPNGPFYIFFNCLLMVLYVMNVYWFQFIVLAAIKILSGTGVKDTREESSGETDSADSDCTSRATTPEQANGTQDKSDEHTQMGLQRLLKLPDNKAPPEFSGQAEEFSADLNQLSPGKSPSQTVNRRLRQRQL